MMNRNPDKNKDINDSSPRENNTKDVQLKEKSKEDFTGFSKDKHSKIIQESDLSKIKSVKHKDSVNKKPSVRVDKDFRDRSAHISSSGQIGRGRSSNKYGELLRSTRETKGLSLEVIHETTKIPLDVLRAIEEGYNVRTLTPFYLKGLFSM